MNDCPAPLKFKEPEPETFASSVPLVTVSDEAESEPVVPIIEPDDSVTLPAVALLMAAISSVPPLTVSVEADESALATPTSRVPLDTVVTPVKSLPPVLPKIKRPLPDFVNVVLPVIRPEPARVYVVALVFVNAVVAGATSPETVTVLVAVLARSAKVTLSEL